MYNFIFEFKYLLFGIFIAGSAMLWFTLLSSFRINRTSRLSLLVERANQKSHQINDERLQDRLLSPKDRAFMEKSRLAGLPKRVTRSNFFILRFCIAFVMTVIFYLSQVPNAVIMKLMTISNWILLFMKIGLIGTIFWFLPILFVNSMAASRRTQFLMEISKLSHRLSICVSENADVRDMILRASRPLKLLKPYIDEMAALWGKDQRAAVWQFKEAVGITEIFPLVNAILAISEADSKDIVEVLHEQTKSIDATLESEVNKRIENAPLWISMYIMVPFFFILVLFLYPWIVTVGSQLLTSFQSS